ncbi:MAG: hypothetical protein U0414_36225 [Polyangiaceae bacterium]
MSNSTPTNVTGPEASFDLAAANSAVAETEMTIDVGQAELGFDPIIGERSLLLVKPILMQLDPSTIIAANIDSCYAANEAASFATNIETPRIAERFAKMHADYMGDATPAFLRTLAQALFYVETRARTKAATASNVQVSVALVNEGVELRERMLRVLGYWFQDDPTMAAELANIRIGSGYMDLASDLARLATHYTQHLAVISQDKKHYNANDHIRARGIAKEIFAALQGATDNAIVDLRNRAFTKLLQVYSRLKAAGEFIFADSPMDLALFPALRQAVVARTARNRRGAGDAAGPETADVPVTAPAAPPVHVPVAAPPGTGPGGSPIV